MHLALFTCNINTPSCIVFTVVCLIRQISHLSLFSRGFWSSFTWHFNRSCCFKIVTAWLLLLPVIHHCIRSPFTLCNEQSCLLHICWKQSFSMMHPSHSLPLSVTLSCTHKTQDQTTLATHIHLSILLYRNGLGQLSQPPLCFTVVVTLLLVSPQWSAGYSLNLWLLHNL